MTKKKVLQKQNCYDFYAKKVAEKQVMMRQIYCLFVFMGRREISGMFSCCWGYNVRTGILNIF